MEFQSLKGIQSVGRRTNSGDIAGNAQPWTAPNHPGQGETWDPHSYLLAHGVLRVVAATYAVSAHELLTKPRRRTACLRRARHVAIYLLRTSFNISPTHLARAFCCDRATIAYACRKIEDQRDNPVVDHLIDAFAKLAEAVEREGPNHA